MNLNEILGEENCRKLTKFGGWCWHECDEDYVCDNCHQFIATNKEMRLDFSDPRVVWRLIEKYTQQMLSSDDQLALLDALLLPNKAEAVCRAVLAFIEEGEKP